jgi:toxin ParE1/3/4
VTTVSWTERAQDDLAAIQAFVSQDSPHAARVVVRRLIAAAARLREFPQSGRQVPELRLPSIREVVLRPYRIVYRVVSDRDVHIPTVHHGSMRLP